MTSMTTVNRIYWLRCDCGKLHAAGGITTRSVCTCKRDLWTMVWR